MSSKELGTLAPPSGSPYGTMIYQMEALEVEMKRKFEYKRRETTTSDNILNSDESQASTATTSSIRAQQVANANERANEMRTRRRAEHTQAVVDDLCKIVADLFIAEAKLINPFNYGVVAASASANASASDAVVTTTHSPANADISSTQQQYHTYNNIQMSIQNFVTSLPSRYVFSADTPSEVLLHMRLMAAVRNDKSKAVVHIHNFSDDDDKNWNLTVTTGKGNRSLRLVTISCHDAVGLLEYVTRLLSSGGSRVLDADVMLSSDGIVLVGVFIGMKECFNV
jgi:hypothetical protein